MRVKDKKNYIQPSTLKIQKKMPEVTFGSHMYLNL